MIEVVFIPKEWLSFGKVFPNIAQFMNDCYGLLSFVIHIMYFIGFHQTNTSLFAGSVSLIANVVFTLTPTYLKIK